MSRRSALHPSSEWKNKLPCSIYCSTLNMEIVCFSETFVNFQQTTQNIIPQESTPIFPNFIKIGTTYNREYCCSWDPHFMWGTFNELQRQFIMMKPWYTYMQHDKLSCNKFIYNKWTRKSNKYANSPERLMTPSIKMNGCVMYTTYEIMVLLNYLALSELLAFVARTSINRIQLFATRSWIMLLASSLWTELSRKDQLSGTSTGHSPSSNKTIFGKNVEYCKQSLPSSNRILQSVSGCDVVSEGWGSA
jgi:hypothetical protein